MSTDVALKKESGPSAVIKSALAQMPFEDSLPSNISPDKFRNAIMTAVNFNPELLEADQKTLLTASMKSANDGLIPDGREAVFNVYKTKVMRGGAETWIKAVQYMPMAYGIIKRMRNSGEIASISARCVYKNDEFTYVLGDDERIIHKPEIEGDPGPVVGAYAIVKFKDGADPQREFMPRAQIDKIRAASKSKDGPAWTQWYDEMARKSVLKRISKYLPMSAENASFLKALDDDDMVDVTPADESGPDVAALPKRAKVSRLDQFEAEIIAPADPVVIDHDPEPVSDETV